MQAGHAGLVRPMLRERAPNCKAAAMLAQQKGALARPFRFAAFGNRLSAWRTGSSCAPWLGRTSCARPRAGRG
jgi:hypothetical protein